MTTMQGKNSTYSHSLTAQAKQEKRQKKACILNIQTLMCRYIFDCFMAVSG